MSYYAYGCSNLTSLSVPDTSGLTSEGGSFMGGYASIAFAYLSWHKLPGVGYIHLAPALLI